MTHGRYTRAALVTTHDNLIALVYDGRSTSIDSGLLVGGAARKAAGSSAAAHCSNPAAECSAAPASTSPS